MDSIQEVIAAVVALVAAVSALVARFNETSSELGFVARVFKTLDLTQIFDSTRSLGDLPVEYEDLDDGEDFDAPVE